jgi:hypothetical protein
MAEPNPHCVRTVTVGPARARPPRRCPRPGPAGPVGPAPLQPAAQRLGPEGTGAVTVYGDSVTLRLARAARAEVTRTRLPGPVAIGVTPRNYWPGAPKLYPGVFGWGRENPIGTSSYGRLGMRIFVSICAESTVDQR